MLTDAQKRHFEAFGYVFLRQLFDAQEMARLTESFDHTVTAACDERDEPQDQNLVDKVETTPDLCWLLEEGRLLDGITDLAGPGFIWCGSEGNIKSNSFHGFHPAVKVQRACGTAGVHGEVDFGTDALLFIMRAETLEHVVHHRVGHFRFGEAVVLLYRPFAQGLQVQRKLSLDDDAQYAQ